MPLEPPNEFPVRPQGELWPGLRSKRGKVTSQRPGEMSDCSNVEILSDLLMKRRGFIRGIDEWFDQPVCGLFAYTDFCQNEYILVATQDGIAVRQPFIPPSVQIADCYPFDEFAGSGLANLDADQWKFVATTLGIDGNAVGLKATARSLSTFDVEAIIDSSSASWFKLACKASYELQLNLDFPDTALEPHIAGLMRGAQRGFQSGSFLMFDFFRRGNLTFGRIMHVKSDRSSTEIATIGPFADGNGIGLCTYNQSTLTATITFTPDVGTSATSSNHVTGLDDAAFGLATGFSIFFLAPTAGQLRPSSLSPPALGLDDIQSAGA